MNDKSAAEHRADAERIARLFRTLYELNLPTIAACGARPSPEELVSRPSVTSHCEPAAKFGYTEVRIDLCRLWSRHFLRCRSATSGADLLLTGRSSMRPRRIAWAW